jgi:hypothetical protein
MAEMEAVREREREAEANSYERVFARRARFRDQTTNGKVVMKGSDAPWENSRQGRLRYILWPGNWEQASVPNWMIFIHDIHTSADGITTSGQHRHQGGLGLFVIEGEGYTVVDDVRYDWKAGDFIMLPIKPDGCVHQHFAKHPNSNAKWLAFTWEPYSILMGSPLEQRKVGSLV